MKYVNQTGFLGGKFGGQVKSGGGTGFLGGVFKTGGSQQIKTGGLLIPPGGVSGGIPVIPRPPRPPRPPFQSVPYHTHRIQLQTGGPIIPMSGPIFNRPLGGRPFGNTTGTGNPNVVGQDLVVYGSGTPTGAPPIMTPPGGGMSNFDGSNRRGYADDGSKSNLWFNQNGDDDTGAPIMAGLPSPDATDAQIAADPGYLEVLEDGTVVDANGNIVQNATSVDLGGAAGPDVLPAGPELFAGDRVQRPDGVMGTATGMSLKTLPAQYQVNWDDGMSSNELSSDVVIVSRAADIDPGTPVVNPVAPVDTTPPQPVSKCSDEQYEVPGLDKCIDKTMALVLGAVALYLILNKDK